jgi:DNA polymerase elongation subunit (family B)
MSMSVSKNKVLQKAPNTTTPSTATKVNALMSFRLFDFNFADQVIEAEHVNLFEKGDDSDNDNQSNESNETSRCDTTSESGSSAAPSPVRQNQNQNQTQNHRYKKPPRVFQIQMFGMNEQGKTCSITVPDFKPFFYAKVNCASDCTREWTSSIKTKFISYIKSMVPELKSASGLVDDECELVRHKKLYMFDAGKNHQFIKLVFHSMSAMKRARNLWFIKLQPDTSGSGAKGKGMFESSRMKMNPRGLQFQEYNLTIYESNLPPLLRYFHIREISPSGWISFPLKSAHRVTVPDLKRTTCDYEFIIQKNDITAMNAKEKMVPYNICSFDIEASSSHGDFPIPVKTYKKLAANVVDAVIKHPESLSPAMLETCMCVAFGVSEADIKADPWLFGIERIYPKTRYPNGKRVHCTLAEVKRMSTLWTTTPVDALEAGLKEQGVSNVLKIETMFERIKSREMGGDADLDADLDASFSDNDNDNENDNDDDNDNDDVNDGNDDDYEVGNDNDNDAASTYSYNRDNRDALSVCSRATSVSSSTTTSSKAKAARAASTGPTVLDIIRNTSFDRETKINKVNETMCAAFPPVEGDIVTFIGSTFVKHGQSGPYCNHCIVLDTCDTASIEKDVPNLVIESYPTEREVLLAWTRLIQRQDPDIVIGYNIFGFDYEFMFRRALENRCETAFLQLSRNKGEVCGKRDFETGQYGIEESSVVLASGQYDLRYIKMAGRFQVDLYNYFRRDYNLSSYKLDYVASYFIGDDVKRIEFEEHHSPTESGRTRIYSANLTGLETGNYIIFEETNNSTDAYKNGAKFMVKECNRAEGWFVIDGREELNMTKHVRWGLAKDDVTPQDIFRMTREGPASRAIIAKYCIQDCNLVHHLVNKIDVLTGFIEMSKICSVPMSFLVLRGQGIKLTSYIAKKCREKNTLIPDLDKTGSNEGYEGAIVLPPKCGLYLDNPVVCIDYSSLYPSCIISENLSHDSKVWTKEYDLNGNLVKETGERCPTNPSQYVYDNLPEYDYVDITYDTYRWTKNARGKSEKSVNGTKVCRFAQSKDGTKPILPSILEELLAARKATRKQAESQDDPFMANILDKRQLGYKVTANSLYGQCGAKTSTMYEVDVAAATTATGRKLLTYARRIVEEVYGDTEVDVSLTGGGSSEGKQRVRTRAEYVYGDTDSVFFTFNLQTLDGAPITGKRALEMSIELGQQVGELASRYLKAPHAWTYEKTMMPFFLLRKKGYIGMLYEKNPNKGKRKSMGIVLKRRDNAPIVKDIYGGAIDILMNQQCVDTAIEFVKSAMRELVEERCLLDKLVITKSLRSTYKNPQQIAHKVLADRMGMRDPGNKPGAGDRIPFVYIHSDKKDALQGDKIETPDYITRNKIKPDYAFYITNQIMKPVQQVLALGLEKIGAFRRRRENYLDAVDTINSHYSDDPVKRDKKVSDLRNKEIKEIVFDEFLRICENMKKRNQSITKFFAPIPTKK